MLISTLLGGLLAFAPPADDFTTPPRVAEIWGGQPVEGTEYIEVVHLRVGNATCTGTLIAPNLILTAAHCLNATVDPDDICIMLGETAIAHACWGSSGDTRATGFGMHPKYDPEAENDAWDIGYITTGTFTGIEHPKIITSQSEYDSLVGEDEKIILVGYGQNETGEIDGKKRVVETKIKSFIDSAREFLAGGDGKDTCSGDSGGPAYARAKDGSLRLVGVTSRGTPQCGEGGMYTAPLPSMCWVEEQSGVDILPADCKNCDCVDLTTAVGCGCTTTDGGGAGGLALALFALLGLRRRRQV